FDVLLQLFDEVGAGEGLGREDDEGGDDLAALGVRGADDAALADQGVLEEDALDLDAGDVVAGGDDHVVGACLVPEIAVLVLDVGVAGEVPPVLDVDARALQVVEVAAAGGAAHGQAADGAGRHGLAGGVDDTGLVPRDDAAGGAGTDVVARGADEHVEHLGGTDAVDDRDAGGAAPGLESGDRKGLAGGDAGAQAGDVEGAEE